MSAIKEPPYKKQPLYVVENIITKEIQILPYSEALIASSIIDHEPTFDVYYSCSNPNMKMYPVSDLGPAAKILYGVADE